ncbi:ABC transporter permease [Lacrimispora sp. BS-2]|uniref:ABC transporter permease n=1 Tax=Lacrimispora sp. BS-2 TaxID=3151850 RepID=A0AAU7PUM9_9FIRM
MNVKKAELNIKQILEKNMSAVALILALVLGGLIMLICGYNPVEAYTSILKGAFIGKKAVCQTLVQATPLIFAGLAYTVAKRANLINLGIEGQLYMGALGTSVVALMPLRLPEVVWIPLALMAGVLLGGLYAGLVGFMKVKFGSNEVIATMMLNTIAVNFVAYMVNYPLKEQGKSMAQTAKFTEEVWIPKLLEKTQLTAAIIIAVIACILVKLLFDRTVIGYEIKCVGFNLKASETAGIRIGRIMVIAMLLSGGIAGLLGGSHVLGVDHRLIADFSSGYGFDGIAVAALAADNPVGVILSGIIFGALRAGCMVLNRTTGIPTEFIDVIQALIILFVAAPLLVKEILRIKNAGRGKGGKRG